MKAKELPPTIKSPITGNTLVMVPKPNGVDQSVADFFDDSTECYDPYVMQYSDDNESIYVSYEEE